MPTVFTRSPNRTTGARRHPTIDLLLRIPTRIEPRAKYAVRVLSTIWGVPVRFVSEVVGERTVIYGSRKETDCCSLVIPCDVQAYAAQGSYKAHKCNGTIIWGPAAAASEDCDLIGSVFRLLTLLDEGGVLENDRDRRGVFPISCLPAGRRGVVAEPLVENHAAVLLKKLSLIHPGLKEHALPLWPNGKKYALLMSHDTDAIALGSPLEMLYNLGKAILHTDPVFLRMFKDGFFYLRRPNEDPLFGFPTWRQIENSRFRSCFYLFAKSSNLKWNLHDCRSSVTDKRVDWGCLRSMADQGWEFGLHAPIDAKNDVNALSWAKTLIEERIGQPVWGLRHHYWALDWRHPHRTFRNDAQAGFHYDSSIAWRDSPGFRAGTCLPFRPFDLETNEVLDFYEIPASLVDGHLRESGAAPEEQVAEGRCLISKIMSRGGAAMLNWHTEHACSDYQYRGSVPLLMKILESIVHDSDLWFPTPRELVQYWEQRCLRLAQAADEN